MHAEIIVIGNELLNGDRADSHIASLGAVLRSQGVRVAQAHVIPDESDTIMRVLKESTSRAALVLVTGGLGPTKDDLTMAAAARFLGRPLRMDEETHQRIKKRVLDFGRTFDDGHAKQALIPQDAVALLNRKGTAPGVQIELDDTTVFFFPGVPREVAVLTNDHLQPWLQSKYPKNPTQSRTLRTFGQTESGVARLLDTLEVPTNMHVAYRVHFPEIQITFQIHDVPEAQGQEILKEIDDEARRRLGSLVFSDQPKETFTHGIHRHLTGRDPVPTVAVAESCTGGLISTLITEVPGVSDWFLEGRITYSNDAKIRLLDVQPETLIKHGAVSEAVAREMAEGVRCKAGSDIGIAVTGISGPTGGTPDKPVGTTHFALASDQTHIHKMRHLPFDRSRNRLLGAWSALDLLRRYLLDL